MAKIFNLFRSKREQLQRDLDRELQYHVERRVDELVRDGLDKADATKRANLELGGVAQVREEVRDTWTWRWLDTLFADARYAVRSLIKNWGFSLGTISVLALGIGATVALFSVVNTVLLQPLPYPDANRIVSVETFWANTGRANQDVSGPDFLDWKAQNSVFEKMAALYGNEDAVTIVNDRAVFANSRYVSAEFFSVFGQSASAGRLLSERDIPAGDAEPTIAVVAYHWAIAHFGSAQNAIGKSINVYGSPLQIIGVSSPGFRYPGAADIWAPWRTESGGTSRSLHNYRSVAKLKPGVELARAQLQLRSIGNNIERQYPENRFKSVAVTPLQERLTGNVQMMLWVLMGAVSAVLLIACANISNLLLARASVRTREIALRAALGAGRRRLVRQLLTESCVLGIFAGAVGVLLALVLVRGLVALSPAEGAAS